MLYSWNTGAWVQVWNPLLSVALCSFLSFLSSLCCHIKAKIPQKENSRCQISCIVKQQATSWEKYWYFFFSQLFSCTVAWRSKHAAKMPSRKKIKKQCIADGEETAGATSQCHTLVRVMNMRKVITKRNVKWNSSCWLESLGQPEIGAGGNQQLFSTITSHSHRMLIMSGQGGDSHSRWWISFRNYINTLTL